MAEDWSAEEVEATVSDYFGMLDQELRAQPYNKTEHRHRLLALLKGRSEGAIERKHQNISAVLIELGFAYISGYKPLTNYQRLLFEVVSRRLSLSPALVELVRSEVTEPAEIPTVDDILSVLVSPPEPDPGKRRYGP